MKQRRQVEDVILGKIKMVKDTDGISRKHFVPNSRGHFLAVCNRFGEGKEIGMIPVEDVNLRSRGQLAYHRVLVRYIANDQGLEEDDVHDAMMKEVFGIRRYSLNGKTYEGRYSLSDAGGLKINQVIDLIKKDRDTCSFLGINVPTAEELGYENPKQYLSTNPTVAYPTEYEKPTL